MERTTMAQRRLLFQGMIKAYQLTYDVSAKTAVKALQKEIRLAEVLYHEKV